MKTATMVGSAGTKQLRVTVDHTSPPSFDVFITSVIYANEHIVDEQDPRVVSSVDTKNKIIASVTVYYDPLITVN